MGATVCAALAVRHFPPHLAEMPVWAPAAAAVAFNLAGWLFVLDFFRARKP
jgi:hypothetical protein